MMTDEEKNELNFPAPASWWREKKNMISNVMIGITSDPEVEKLP